MNLNLLKYGNTSKIDENLWSTLIYQREAMVKFASHQKVIYQREFDFLLYLKNN